MADQDPKDLSYNVVTDQFVEGHTEALDVRAFDADPFHEADNDEGVNEVAVPGDEDEKPEPKKTSRKRTPAKE